MDAHALRFKETLRIISRVGLVAADRKIGIRRAVIVFMRSEIVGVLLEPIQLVAIIEGKASEQLAKKVKAHNIAGMLRCWDLDAGKCTSFCATREYARLAGPSR